jgi:hypothetical protein
MSNVTATNTTGCDAKSLVKTVIKYNGAKVKKLDTSKPGMYRVIYKLKDEIGRKAKPVKTKVFVTGAEVTPVITGTHDLYIKSKSALKPDLVKNSITVTQGSTKLDNKYITVSFKKVKQGQWKADITAQYASKPANAYIYVYLDKQKPTITGVVNGNTYYLASMSAVSKEYARSLIEVSDDITVISKDSVKIKIVNETTRVKVVYKAFDAAGRKRKVIIYFTQQQSPLVSPTPTPVSPTNQPVTGSVVSR